MCCIETNRKDPKVIKYYPDPAHVYNVVIPTLARSDGNVCSI